MKTLCLLVIALWPMAAAAQPAGNNDLIISLYNQLEALQREVQTLRGIVEEQSYQLRRMETEQRDRYLDIDRRLNTTTPGALPGSGIPDGTSLPGIQGQDTRTPQSSQPDQGADAGGLSSTIQPAFNTTAPNSPLPPTARNDSSQTQPGAQSQPGSAVSPSQTQTPAVEQMDEQELYRTALALLLEQNAYEESIRLFQNYIDRFPQRRLLTNAFYWQGEALLLVARYNEARDVFTRIITDYPSDPKAASAMLKLGVAYQQMGDEALAASTWRDISTRYPENLTEIGFAQDYLNRL